MMMSSANDLPQLQNSDSAHQTLVEQYYDQQIIQREECKFECVICGKLFKGKEFVVKHIHNKHFNEFQSVNERLRKRAREEAMFINYTLDPLVTSDLERNDERIKLRKRSRSHENEIRINKLYKSQMPLMNPQMIIPIAQMNRMSQMNQISQIMPFMMMSSANANTNGNMNTNVNQIPQRTLRNYNDVDATSIVQIVPNYDLLLTPNINNVTTKKSATELYQNDQENIIDEQQ